MIRKNKDIILILFTLCFTVLVFAPIQIYLTNRDFFWFSIYNMGYFVIPYFVVGFLSLVLFMIFLRKVMLKIGNWFMVILSAISFSTYVQGNFILANYGQMDGKAIDWKNFRIEGIISVSVWLGIAIICIGCYLKMKNKIFSIFSNISLVMTAMQVVTIFVLMVTNNPFVIENVYTATNKNEYVYGEKENFVILLLDRFDSQVLVDILEKPDKEYDEILEDFTFYPDTLGMFPCTDLAIPHILSGIPYQNEETYGEYVSYAYAESPFLQRLDQEGYELGIYSNITLPHEIPSDTITSKIVNWDDGGVGVNSHKNLSIYMYKLVGFRYLPQPLKKYCWFYPDDIAANEKVVNSNEEEAYSWLNEEFYNNIDNISIGDKEKIFKFIHLDGTHEDFTFDRNFEEKGSTSIEEEGRGILLVVNEYLERLKEQNIFDNSVIVIMADHGHYGMQQSPLLMIKGKNEKHKFEIANKAVSYDSLQEIFEELLDGRLSKDIFLNEVKERKYYFYKYKFNLKYEHFASDIVEYSTKGSAHDEKKLLETGKIYRGIDN